MPAPWARGAECRIVGKIHGADCVSVFHFATNTVVQDGPPMDTLLLQLAQAMLQCAIDTLLPAVTSDYTLVRCDATQVFPSRGDAIVATAPANTVGALGPTSVSFISSLVNMRTGQGGRRGRGKKFLPPPGEAQSANSLMDGPTSLLLVEFLVCLAGKFINVGKTTDWQMGVYSRKDGGTKPPNFDAGFRIVTQLTPSQTLARAGSRKIGKGS